MFFFSKREKKENEKPKETKKRKEKAREEMKSLAVVKFFGKILIYFSFSDCD